MFNVYVHVYWMSKKIQEYRDFINHFSLFFCMLAFSHISNSKLLCRLSLNSNIECRSSYSLVSLWWWCSKLIYVDEKDDEEEGEKQAQGNKIKSLTYYFHFDLLPLDLNRKKGVSEWGRWQNLICFNLSCLFLQYVFVCVCVWVWKTFSLNYARANSLTLYGK